MSLSNTKPNNPRFVNQINDKPLDNLIIWNPKHEKGILIEITQQSISNKKKYKSPITAFKIIYYMVHQNSNHRGRLIGTCLPNIIYWQDGDLYQLKKNSSRLIHWAHPDYFLVGPSDNPLTHPNVKFELYYWPEFTEYPSLAINNIPATTKSNGDITLYLDPKHITIEHKYYPIEIVILVIGYDDFICGPQSGLGSRRFQKQIFSILSPKHTSSP
jgi:hypothetical protein